MRELADGVQLLRGWPPNAINVYLAGPPATTGLRRPGRDVLIDAATRRGERRIMRELAGRTLSAHALTHAHPDHQGSSHAICTRLGIPLWCGQGDVPAMETPDGIAASQPHSRMTWFQRRFWTGPPHPVARALLEGDEVAGFTVLETPGHSRGHVAYWRESDRVLILGDVLNNMNLLTGRPGLHEPPVAFTPDPERNRASARRLAELRPRLACFGHGPPLRDPGRLAEFVARLPAPRAAAEPRERVPAPVPAPGADTTDER
ncbi:MAG TPA: MBL fold metallo-hydrolase [Solirubrobacteraceae bacterium]|nr:MBL fold metallo-hydrolase [Solirubrobacteraceae bacterium]